MTVQHDRRSRRRLATREAISTAATRLFVERGFDAVTIDEIAAAADVGRMTVFNHFARKEDMFFDRDEAGRELLREVLRERNVAPVEALRRLAHRLCEEKSPYVTFSEGSLGFVATVEASATLMARARAIRDELTMLIAEALSERAGHVAESGEARLAAAMLVATWSTAFIEAHRVYRVRRRAKEATAMFLACIDRGSRGVQAAIAGTAHARR